METWKSSVAGALLLLLSAGHLHAQDTAPTVTIRNDDGVDVFGAFGDSVKLLLIEHTIRIAAQEKTRRELGGPSPASLACLPESPN